MSDQIARLQTDIERAKLAKQLLENPLTMEFIQRMKADIYLKIENSNRFQRRLREELYRELKTVVKFERLIQNTFSEGGRSLKLLEKMTKQTRIKAIR